MRTSTTPTATASKSVSAGLSGQWTTHAVAAAWVVAFLAFGYFMPLTYSAWLQEDGFVEWLTAALFAAAGIMRLRYAWRSRRWLDLLIAAFCIFVAGEEFSWGQRLLGFTPPDVFLAHNKQQEFTLHNFAELFGQPKGVLTLALLGYAFVLPLLARLRVPMTPPPRHLTPWFAVAAALLLWYPLELTGEWVEALAGWLLLASAGLSRNALFKTAALAVIVSALLAVYSARGSRASTAAIACAQREVQALLNDIAGGAATIELQEHRGRVHKRLYTAIEDGYVDSSSLRGYRAVGCGQSQRYGLDPWGMPYWLEVGRGRGLDREIMVYSMGANRRRDSGEDVGGGDDVVAGPLR